MSSKRMTRRALLRGAALSGMSLALLAACEPKVVEKLVKETVEVEKEKIVKETVVVKQEVQKEVTKVVEKVVTATPVPKEELKGEITILWWGLVGNYEKSPGSVETHWLGIYNLIREWEAAHPKVKVNWRSLPDTGDQTTIERTQLATGTLPDLVCGWLWGLKDQWALVYDWQQELEKPNPYGSFARWRDEFPMGVPAQADAPQGGVYMMGPAIPGDMAYCAFYFNKTMFQEAGFDKQVDTWADLMDASAKLAQKGHAAYFGDATKAVNCCCITWLIEWLADDIGEPILRQFAHKITPEPADCSDPATAKNPWACGPRPTQEEKVWAVKNGVWRADDPRFLEVFRLLKEFSKYWNKDWTSPEQVDYLLTKRVAVLLWTLGSAKFYMETPERDFKLGTFSIPKVTKESSPYATSGPAHIAMVLGGGRTGGSLYVPKTTEEHGNLPIVRDLLQFLTAAPSNERYCKIQFPPCIPKGKTFKDVVTDPEQRDMLAGFYQRPLTYDTAGYGLDQPGSESWDARLRLFVQYAKDDITLEKLGKELQGAFERDVEKAILDNPNWKVKEWPKP